MCSTALTLSARRRRTRRRPGDDPELEIGEAASGIADALRALGAVERGGINQTSGGHFAYIPGGGLFPAALGDLLADVGHRYSGVHFAAPAAMGIALIRWMCGLVGYPEAAGGDLTSGASIANLEGIVTARDAMQVRSADIPRTVAYITEQTHHCIEKALRISGLGESIVRQVRVDEMWRMDPNGLDAAVREDLAAGLRPWLVVATAGRRTPGLSIRWQRSPTSWTPTICGCKWTPRTEGSSS